MMLTPSTARLLRLIAPLDIEGFLHKVETSQLFHSTGVSNEPRLSLSGDPTELLIEGWPAASSKLTWHSAFPQGPAPDPLAADCREAFANCIALFHKRGYSVRFADVREISSELDLTARAVEQLFRQPVSASAFWSGKGLRAPVHFDDHDIIAVQLKGEKDWIIRTEPSDLKTNAMGMAEEPPSLGTAPCRVTMRPGDLLYVPRGLAHTVVGEAESVHVAFGFTPVTVRDALVSIVDLLMESDRSFRRTLDAPGDFEFESAERISCLSAAIRRVAEASASSELVTAALELRAARATREMRRPAGTCVESVTAESVLRRRADGVCFIRPGPERLELSFPGGRIFVHPAAEAALRFMTKQPGFRISEIPGNLSLDANVALASQMVKIGFLELTRSYGEVEVPHHG